jgi:hypothetical protein
LAAGTNAALKSLAPKTSRRGGREPGLDEHSGVPDAQAGAVQVQDARASAVQEGLKPGGPRPSCFTVYAQVRQHVRQRVQQRAQPGMSGDTGGTRLGNNDGAAAATAGPQVQVPDQRHRVVGRVGCQLPHCFSQPAALPSVGRFNVHVQLSPAGEPGGERIFGAEAKGLKASDAVVQ